MMRYRIVPFAHCPSHGILNDLGSEVEVRQARLAARSFTHETICCWKFNARRAVFSTSSSTSISTVVPVPRTYSSVTADSRLSAFHRVPWRPLSAVDSNPSMKTSPSLEEHPANPPFSRGEALTTVCGAFSSSAAEEPHPLRAEPDSLET